MTQIKDMTEMSKYFSKKNIPWHINGYSGEILVVRLRGDKLNKTHIEKLAKKENYKKIEYEV